MTTKHSVMANSGIQKQDAKIAIVGCGYWGKNLVRNFAELGVLTAICDANKEQAVKLSQAHGNPAILSMDEIAESSDITGVVLATPAVHHAAHATKFLRSGKNVFVEKPLALTLSDAESLAKIAREQKRILMVGHVLQYHPAYIKLGELIRAGELGIIHYVYSNRKSLGKIRTEEDVLWSFAPHDLSLVLGLIPNEIESVHAEASTYLSPNVASFSTTHLRFSKKVNAHIFVSWLNPFKEQKLVVIGEKAMAVFDDCQNWDNKLMLYPHEYGIKDEIPYTNKADGIPILCEQAEPLKQECQHFIDCINSGKTPRTDPVEATRVLKALHLSEKSIKEQRIVRVEEADRGDEVTKEQSYYKHESAYVDDGAHIGAGTKIWHFSHILKDVNIGENTIIGQNVMIGPDVRVGNRCKIQNNVSLYKGVILDDDVFCGPSCVFTNVNNPRANIERKDEFRLTHVEKGVTIGANSTIVCGVRLGAYCFIGAGATVTKDVKPFALMVGTPARQIGWMSHAGEKLGPDLICPREGKKYKISNDLLELIA